VNRSGLQPELLSYAKNLPGCGEVVEPRLTARNRTAKPVKERCPKFGLTHLETVGFGQGRTSTRGAAIRQQVEDRFEELFAKLVEKKPFQSTLGRPASQIERQPHGHAL
jgi:hypothetical protein